MKLIKTIKKGNYVYIISMHLAGIFIQSAFKMHFISVCVLRESNFMTFELQMQCSTNFATGTLLSYWNTVAQ